MEQELETLEPVDKLEKLEQLERSRIVRLTKNETDKLCSTIVDGFTKKCERTHATFGAVSEEGSNVRGVDDGCHRQEVTVASSSTCAGKGVELPQRPWCVRESSRANCNCDVTTVDTHSGSTQTRRQPKQVMSRNVAREFESRDRPDLLAGTPPLDVLKAILFIAVKHNQTFGIVHTDVSRAYVHAKAQRALLVRLWRTQD